MTNHVSLTLQGVSYQLPDGSSLFADLHEQFDGRPTGVVGRNGIGKSVLARILAGELEPTSGKCLRIGRTHYLAQQIAPQHGQTLADLAGVRHLLDALRRVEHGSTQQADFDLIADHWNLPQRLQHELAGIGLAHLHADTTATQLSGGEAMRVALVGAFLSGAETLILDEPSNHLDREHRSALLDQLQRWTGGLIIVSHDRELLDTMQRIVELSSLGLRSYGGGYSFYAQAKAHEQHAAMQQLEQRKNERRREERALSAQRERLERRQTREAKRASTANQAAILLGRQKERSENSAGKLHAQHEQARNALSLRVREAAQKLEQEMPVLLFAPEQAAFFPNRVATLQDLELPHLPATQRIDFSLFRGQRIGLVGPNGSGKSTFLKLLAGHLTPASGHCRVFVETAYLDQQLSTLAPERSVLDQLLGLNSAPGEAALRTRLALLGLHAEQVMLPTQLLSGGEKLKAALACALYADRPAQLLLLDEPDNHLDLASVRALEAMLRQYQGTLIVVSHDPAFLDNLDLNTRLQACAGIWSMHDWQTTAALRE